MVVMRESSDLRSLCLPQPVLQSAVVVHSTGGDDDKPRRNTHCRGVVVGHVANREYNTEMEMAQGKAALIPKQEIVSRCVLVGHHSQPLMLVDSEAADHTTSGDAGAIFC